jgi:hypothetical protein
VPVLCVQAFTVIYPGLPLNYIIERGVENDMSKWIGLILLILFLGDPELSFLNQLGALKELLVVMTIGLFAMPWAVSQMDN